VEAKEIPIDQLLLDPNNYRLQDLDGFVPPAEDRYHLEQVQKATMQRLRDSLKELQNSIMSNGFLAIERIVVTPYTHAEGKYLVIEGNRRVAALRALKEQNEAGVPIPPKIITTFGAVPCIVAEQDEEFPFFKETLMGIRHVGGIKQWGGYQRAKLIADLLDIHSLDAGEVGNKLGLSVQEVNRRYRAFKALQQMQDNEEFGEFATPAMYPILHEAVSLPTIREWLEWKPGQSFTNDKELEKFYRLITPTESDEGGENRPPRVSTFSDVRELRTVIADAEAKSALLDQDRSLLDALTIAHKDEMSKKWRGEVAEARTALEKIGAIDVSKFQSEDVTAIEQLVAVANQILQIHNTLAK